MKASLFRPLILLALSAPYLALAQKTPSLSADAIMKKSESSRRTPNLKAEAKISTTGDGSPSDKNFKFWRKLTADGKRFRMLTRFTAPTTVRDQAILFLERDSDSSDIFMYLPTFKRTRRVESHAQSGSFMGTAFSYSDIATPNADDYKNSLNKTEPCPGGGTCHVITSVPKTPGVIERTGYSKSVQWIDSTSWLPVKGEFFDKAGKLKKTVISSEIKAVDPAKKYWFAHSVQITDHSSGRKSHLVFSNVDGKETLRDSLFTQSALESP